MIFFLIAFIASSIHAAPAPGDLRLRLDIVLNEARLAIRNRSAHRTELDRMRRRAEYLRMSERIPFKEDLGGLVRELSLGAAKRELLWRAHRVIRRQPAAKIPSRVFSDQPRVRLSDQQLAQEVDLSVRVQGELLAIERWIEAWPDEMLRYVELIAKPKKISEGLWEIRLRTFRFRSITFPKIVVRAPEVPNAEKARFERQLAEIRKLGKAARKDLDLLGKVLLERARFEYFARRVGNDLKESP